MPNKTVFSDDVISVNIHTPTDKFTILYGYVPTLMKIDNTHVIITTQKGNLHFLVDMGFLEISNKKYVLYCLKAEKKEDNN